MNQKMKYPRKTILLILFCVLLLSFSIMTLFFHYRRKINEEFDVLIKENLTAYTVSQKQEVVSTIQDIQGTLQAIAVMAETSSHGPLESWIADYLNVINKRQNGQYTINYITMENLYETILQQNSSASELDTYNRLLRAESIVSEVRFSNRLGKDYYYSIAVPTTDSGRTVGVLRSVMKADQLVRTLQTGYFRESVHSYLVKQDGQLIHVSNDGSDDTLPELNIYEALQQNGVSEQNTALLKAAISENKEDTYHFTSGEASFYCSVTSLGYNGWHIFNVTEARDVALHSSTILNNTVWSGVILVLITAAVGILVYRIVRRQWRRLELEHSRYAALASFSDTILFEYYYQTDTIEFTSNATKLLNLDSHQIYHPQDKLNPTGRLHPQDREKTAFILKNLPAEGVISQTELRFLMEDETYHWYSCQYQVIYESGGRPAILLGKLTDISLQKEKELGLLKQSEQDSLTGLYNKGTFCQRVQKALQTEKSGVFFMIDVDNFKTVNDTYGHAAGDQVLNEIGIFLVNVFRKSDLIGRIGGDEFAVFMPGTSNHDIAVVKAETLLDNLAGITCSGHTAGISCSIGISCYPEDGSSYGTLYQSADQAMYLAKQQGKNRYCFTVKQQ
ncbi:sensor domain-containing diguanylate cyclase [Anaerolentibacter hominis]|uniref:sensor domain-containing diguanylate cyclase n=1 Tax=Anaerolentibacter hominis TaxID=3079009 RepID=UPI0031B811DD